MQIYLEENAYAPVRAHATDAGMDIRTNEGKILKAHSSESFRTGVHIKLPHSTAGLFVSKSGLNVKHDITSTGLIDEGYEGELIVKLYNHGDTDYEVKAGDKITQLVVIPVLYEPVEITDRFDSGSERGTGGFGSTGK